MMKRSMTVAALAPIAGGGRPADRAAEAPPAETEAPRVALVLKTLNSPFFIDMERGAQEAAKRLG